MHKSIYLSIYLSSIYLSVSVCLSVYLYLSMSYNQPLKSIIHISSLMLLLVRLEHFFCCCLLCYYSIWFLTQLILYWNARWNTEYFFAVNKKFGVWQLPLITIWHECISCYLATVNNNNMLSFNVRLNHLKQFGILFFLQQILMISYSTRDTLIITYYFIIKNIQRLSYAKNKLHPDLRLQLIRRASQLFFGSQFS